MRGAADCVPGSGLAWIASGIRSRNWRIPRRERGRELLERAAHVAFEGRAREALDQRSREVERTQLRQREASVVQPAKGLLLERPVLLAVMQLVEQRESRLLQRIEVAPDRPRGDTGLPGEVVDRGAA